MRKIPSFSLMLLRLVLTLGVLASSHQQVLAQSRRCDFHDVPPFTISTDVRHAKLVSGSVAEIRSDDYTEVGVSYQITPAADQKRVFLSIKWYAQELNQDRSRGKTRIESFDEMILMVASDQSRCRFVGVEGVPMRDERVHIYEGEVHAPVPFPAVGPLHNIFVTFDAPGPHDLKAQALSAKFTGFRVRLEPY